MSKKPKFLQRIKNMRYVQDPLAENNHLKSRLVGRTIRHIEPWSVFKVSLFFYFAIWLVFMFVGMILWGVASAANLINRLENFTADLLALESYDLSFTSFFFIYAAGGIAVVFIATAFTVLMSIIFNQICGIIGGPRLLVLEEETLRLASPEASSPASQKQEGL